MLASELCSWIYTDNIDLPHSWSDMLGNLVKPFNDGQS